MELTGYFNLQAKSKSELKALLREVFNALGNPDLSKVERRKVQRLLRRIRQQIAVRR